MTPAPGGDAAVKRISSRLAKARSVRGLIESRLDDCYRYALPGRTGFSNPQAGGAPEEIYDETAVVALEDFASVVHSRMTPDAVEWISLHAADSVEPRDRGAVDADLAEICSYAFERIHASNYTQEAQESFLDLGCSTAAMIVEMRDGELAHSSVPMTQSYFEAGANDDIGGMFRERRDVRAELLPVMYPGARLSPDLEKLIAGEPDKPLAVVDAMWRTPTGAQRAVMVSAGGGVLRRELVVDEPLTGPGSAPFLGFRFSKAAGEVYGRGPIMKVMAGIKTTNLVIELMLQNAAMSMVGMFQYEDDGVLNARTIRLEPGAMIPHAPGSQGLRRVNTAGQEFNVAGLVLDQQRMNIKRGTYSDALADPNRTPATAQEILYRTQDLAGRISANVGRMNSEYTKPYFRRVLHLLEAAGEIELPVPMRQILMTPQGPLARAVRQQSMNALIQLHEVVASIYGPQLAAAQYDPAELVAYLREILGAPARPFAAPEQAKRQVEAAMSMIQGAGEVPTPQAQQRSAMERAA